MAVEVADAWCKVLTSVRQWVKGKKDNATSLRKELKTKLAAIDTLIDKGVSSSTHLEDCLDIMNHLSSLDNTESIELAQKAKVKWSIEGDENSKKFHGIINKRHNNLAIRGIIIDGEWIEDPIANLERVFVKEEIKEAVWDCGLDKSLGPD
ncbi:hypothetical protein Tco_0904525, partial [Tanacetum coccineum]